MSLTALTQVVMSTVSSPTTSLSSWALSRTEEVLAAVERLVMRRAVSDDQRRLLGVALQGLRVQADEWSGQIGGPALLPFVHLPLLVYAGLGGDERAAVPVSIATSLLYLGIDIFDDVADGDRPERWSGHGPAEMNLAAATLLCSLPQLAISELEAPPARVSDMQRTVALGLLRMSAGQQTDLASAGSSKISADTVEASVALKSGEEVATFARLAAQFAGTTAEIIETYAAIGRAIGTAGQLSSDCHDLFHEPSSRDLGHGTRTLPIAMHLNRLDGEERTGFLGLLEQARTDPDAQTAVRERLRRAGDLRRCAFIVETYCQQALRLLNQANPTEFGRRGLWTMIDNVSFFPKGVEA